MTRFIINAALLTWCAVTFAGCASLPQKEPLQHRAAGNETGRSGVVYLALKGNDWSDSPGMKPLPLSKNLSSLKVLPRKKVIIPQKISIVEVEAGHRIAVAKVVMPVYSGDLLIDALRQELTTAGFTVRLVRELPGTVGSGIVISLISADLRQASGLFILEGSCHMQMEVDVWQNGTRAYSQRYASKVSDYAFTNRDQLLLKLMMMATKNIMSESMPEIVTKLSSSGN